MDPLYTGLFDDTETYYTNDLAAYNDVIYKSLTIQGPGSFNATFWEEQPEGIDYLGFVPPGPIPGSPSFPTIDGDSTQNIQSVTSFGSAFDVNDSGSVLAVAFDDLVDSSVQKKLVVYRL